MTDKSLQAVMRDYHNLDLDIKDLEATLADVKAKRDKCKATLAEHVGAKGELTIGKYTVKTWTQTKHNVDVKKLMAEDMDTYTKYAKPDTIAQYCNVKVAEA